MTLVIVEKCVFICFVTFYILYNVAGPGVTFHLLSLLKSLGALITR